MQNNLWMTANTVMGGELAPIITKLRDEGRSTRYIAAWLGERGVFVSHPTVATWLDAADRVAAA